MRHLAGIEYAKAVVAGEIVAGKDIISACSRFLTDLEKTEWRWHFEPKRAEHIIAFIETFCVHVKGELAGEPIKLEPWQIWMLSNIYGFADDDGVRRIQLAIIFCARKQGKSLLSSAIAIYEMLFGEDGGELYSVANKSDQAKITWDAAVQMIRKSDPRIYDQFKILVGRMEHKDKWSIYKPLGRDSKNADGLSPSLTIFDEIAANADRNMIEVMVSATGARKNFLHLMITTAQFSSDTAFFEHLQYMRNILDGTVEDDRWFGALYALDDESELDDPSMWIKANPNLGISISEEYLASEVAQAKQMTSKKSSVLTKHFNIFCSTQAAWIDVAHWNQSAQDTLDRKGEMYIGVDLAKTRDLTSVCRMWVNGDHYEVDWQFFLPKKSMDFVPMKYQTMYRKAVDDGILHLTDTTTTDYEQVKQYLLRSIKDYNFQVLGYDPWNATQLINELQDSKVNLLEVPQAMKFLSRASKTTEELILEHNIRHEGHPFISWQLSNCEVYTDVSENIRVNKGQDPAGKIDAIVSMIVAMSLAAGKLGKAKTFSFAVAQL